MKFLILKYGLRKKKSQYIYANYFRLKVYEQVKSQMNVKKNNILIF